MNGRVYDPITCRFLSVDPYVQDPGNTQGLNRYTYCLNNPLIYTDPDGEFWHLVAGALKEGVFNWLNHGADFSRQGFNYFMIGASAGAIGTGISSGISSALADGGTFFGGVLGTTEYLSIGAISGFLSGFSKGYTSGYILGFGNALLNPAISKDEARLIARENALGYAYFMGFIGMIDGVSKADKEGRHPLTGARNQEDMVYYKRNGAYGEPNWENTHISNTGQNNSLYRMNLKRYGQLNEDGSLTIKLPNRGDFTIIEFYDYYTVGAPGYGPSLTYLPGEIPNEIMIIGTRWNHQPINGIGKLFGYHTRTTGWKDFMYFSFF